MIGDGATAVRWAAMYLGNDAQLVAFATERHKNHTQMREKGYAGESGGLLAAAQWTSAKEEAVVLVYSSSIKKWIRI